jgi:hypothetical protein
VTAAEFQAWFIGGQFSTLNDSVIEGYLARATPYFAVTRWGAWLPEGIANWVAHSIIVDRAEAAGSIDEIDSDDATSERFAGISTSRHADIVMASVKDPFLRTTYGRRYAYLRRMVGLGGAVV